MSPVTVSQVQESLATGLDTMAIEALRANTKADALILARSLRELARQAELLAEVLD